MQPSCEAGIRPQAPAQQRNKSPRMAGLEEGAVGAMAGFERLRVQVWPQGRAVPDSAR